MISIPARRIMIQRVRSLLAAPGSARLAPVRVELRLPTNQSPSVFPAGQVAVETRNCLAPGFP